MAPFYAAKPDNALKRAEELLAQGQDAIALQTLNEAILSKRARTNPLNVMEPMMLKYIELCVNQRQGRMMKEGLHQYRNFAQNTSVNSIEIIVNKLVELSEQKVAEARAKADQIAVEVIDDLEASETPESIMLSTVSGEQSKDRTDRAVVTPWLKFLWEVYRTVLDLLRNNARLETLYHTVTKNAFTFCLTYARKTEFRRLCEILRNHFQNVSKYSHQPHSINLNDPDTLQQYLEVRFNQLNAAAELELWQEAFKSVEDIYTLLTTSKRPPKPVMMANYYDKLTKIFMVSEDYLFHSAAWNRYSNIERAINKNLTEEEQSRMASVVLLSALAIPIITTTKTRPGYVEADEHRIQKLNRLSMLMGLTQHPTRTGLLKEALNKNILARVRPEIRDLYNILEVQFHPLSICKKINPIMAKLSEDADMAKYVRPLHQVILTRLLQQLSQVYTTVKLDFVLKLASFPAPFNYDAATIEKFIMNGCKRGELSIRIDHASQSLIFETDLFAAPKGTITEGNQLQSSPSELMRTQLSRLGISLHAVVQMIDPSVKETAAKAKQEVVSRAIEGAEKEHKAALARKSTIEQRKEIIETELARLEKQAAQEKAIAAQKKAEAEKKRMEEEQRRREEERTKRVKEEIQRDQAKRIAEEITAKTGLELKPEQIEQSDVQSLLDLKVSRMQSEQREMSERLKQIGKRLDHTERAFRKEEIPLLEKDYERQQKADKAYFEAARKAEATAARDAHEQGMVLKKRFARLLGDYNEYKQQYDSKRQQAVDAARRQAEEAIEKEKQERIAEWRIARDELIKAQETAEAERKRREEEEQRIREEEEREAAEKAERLAREKEESAEQERKLAEQARKQAEREREIERKQAERAAQPAAPRSEAYVSPSQKGGAYVPPAQRSGGAYVPPNLRDRSAAAPESSWRNAAPGGAGARGDDKWRRSGAGPGAGAGSGFGSSFGDRRDDRDRERERDRPPMARKAPGAGAGSAPGSGSVNRRW